MTVPGSNILDLAMTVLGSQTVNYFRALDRTLNNIGQNITEFDAGILVSGSFQPVPRRLYEIYGLDFQKSYFTFYVSKNVIDLQRNVSGDQLEFQGQRYQCESNNDWFGEDGWVGVLCVLIDEFVVDGREVFGFNVYNPSFPTLLNDNQNYENGNFFPGGS